MRGALSPEKLDALRALLHLSMVALMLGPTGNLRAPTMKVGKTMLVGFNPESFAETLT